MFVRYIDKIALPKEYHQRKIQTQIHAQQTLNTKRIWDEGMNREQ